MSGSASSPVTGAVPLDAPGLRSRRSLSERLLGPDPRQRAALQRCLMASFVCLIWMGVEVDAWHRGLMSTQALRGLLAFNSVGLLGFWVALRSGWSMRLQDYSLSEAQMVFAALSMAGAYALVPHARAAALQAMCLVLVFGMFRLSPRQIRRIGLASAGILLGAGYALYLTRGERFSFTADFLPAALTCLVMAVMSSVLGQFSRMRERLAEQKQKLRATLQQVEELAIRDGLTGLFNRRHTQALAEQECLRHARSGSPLTFALLDLDHFKQVNDTHGHGVGDEVLAAAAQVLREQLRRTDVIGRWGGEEFLLMLPDTSAADALPVLERARLALAETAVSPQQPALRITFSAGLAQNGSGGAPGPMLEAADKALYAAKAAGRNRCCIHGQERAAG